MIKNTIDLVEMHMQIRYRKSLSEMEISDVPGYWVDKEAKLHPGHPLHSCIGCSGAFKATYSFFDPPREKGRFASKTRSWKIIKEATT